MVFVIFIAGLIIGSFLNAVIFRLHSGDAIYARSSICPHCRHELSWTDLVPVVSYLRLGRRCRYCHKPISWQYPLVELATGIVFVLLARNFQFPISNFQFWGQVIFTCFLIIIFVYDLKHYLILDKVVIPAAGLAFLYQAWHGRVLDALIGALILAGFFAILFFFSKGRWIGGGDIKLGIFLGLLIPFPETIVVFFLAYLIGAVVSGILILIWDKRLTDKVPFGTFLTASTFIAMLYGEELIVWYLGLIGIK